MHYLLLSIIASTSVMIIFKIMQRGCANTRHSIMLSYAVSGLSGVFIFSPSINIEFAPWFLPAALEGTAFYVVFRAMAKTVQTNGLAVASIASKMSVVIPIMIGLLFLGETKNALIIGGILSGLVAIILSTGNNVDVGRWKWPLFVFVGTGLIDASFKLFLELGLPDAEFASFVTAIFGFAFVVGFAHHLMCKDRLLNKQSILGGISLGLANFGTVYFLLNALATPSIESSVVYALNNFGIVGLSTLVAVLIFREKLNFRGWSGLALTGVSIALIFSGSA